MSNKRQNSEKKIQTSYLPLAFPFLVLGIVTANPAFFAVGFVFFIIALSGGKDQDREGEQ
jgi:hypothetical protein